MEISYEINGKTLIIFLIGELDEHASEYTRQALDRLLSSMNYSGVVFDLSRLAFMDSTGIGVMIGRYKQLKNQNCPVYVKNPSNTIDKILKMSGLYEIMKKVN